MCVAVAIGVLIGVLVGVEVGVAVGVWVAVGVGATMEKLRSTAKAEPATDSTTTCRPLWA